MKFIPPLEISSKIMTLIEESNDELILVSPYVNLSNWDKMKKCILRAVNRGVKITFIARKNAAQDLSFLEEIEIKLVLVKDLHAKLYLNENYGIVTSQNIIYYSDINSIDIAYKTTEDLEKTELYDFIEKYILNSSTVPNNVINRVEYQDHNNTQQLSAWMQKKLAKKFIYNYKKVKFTPTINYVFSSQLLPFSDVMISSIYTIKMNKYSDNCEKIIDEISKVQFNFIDNYRIDLYTGHNKFYYLDFIPINELNPNDLISDYINLTNCILNSNDIMRLVSNDEKKYTNW